jgi:hypothetical protein
MACVGDAERRLSACDLPETSPGGWAEQPLLVFREAPVVQVPGDEHLHGVAHHVDHAVRVAAVGAAGRQREGQARVFQAERVGGSHSRAISRNRDFVVDDEIGHGFPEVVIQHDAGAPRVCSARARREGVGVILHGPHVRERAVLVVSFSQLVSRDRAEHVVHQRRARLVVRRDDAHERRRRFRFKALLSFGGESCLGTERKGRRESGGFASDERAAVLGSQPRDVQHVRGRAVRERGAVGVHGYALQVAA